MLFGIDNPDTLYNLEDYFQAEVNLKCKNKPRLVVGCQLDTRRDPRVIAELLKYSQVPVSQQQVRAGWIDYGLP